MLFTTSVVSSNGPTLDEPYALVVVAVKPTHVDGVKGALGRELPLLDATLKTKPLQGVATSRCSLSRMEDVREKMLRQNLSTGIAD